MRTGNRSPEISTQTQVLPVTLLQLRKAPLLTRQGFL